MSILRVAGLATLVLVLAITAVALPGQTNVSKYAAGQVWEYHNRPQDAGSLVKIQLIGDYSGSKVYHVSIVGVHFATRGISGTLPHIPVSETTLDASVTQLSSATTDFPTTALHDGITEWQKAKGGVFTIPLSQILDIIDDQTGRAQKALETQSKSL